MTPGARSTTSNSAPASGQDRFQSGGNRTPDVVREASKYRAVLATELAHNLAYPGELAVRSVAIVIFLWVFFHLWSATYASAGRPAIHGLTLENTMWYLMLAEAIVLSKPRHAEKVAEAVREGTIAHLLNKPYSFPLYQAAVGLADSVLPLTANVATGGTLVWWLAGPPPGPTGWLLAIPAVLAGWLIDFCISSLIGLSAFVAEDVSAFTWIYGKLVLILGGVLMPLDFMPESVQTIALASPVPYTVYGPARLLVAPTQEAFLHLMAAQAVWLAVLGSAVAIAYRRGVSWLTINGG